MSDIYSDFNACMHRETCIHNGSELSKARFLIKELESQLEQAKKDITEAGEVGWHNFNNMQHIENFLLEKDLLEISANDEDELGAANNIINSFKNVLIQLEQAKKDQERYQCLKSNLGFNANNDSDIGKFEVSIKTKRNEAWCLYDEKLDQAIDEAMQEGK